MTSWTCTCGALNLLNSWTGCWYCKENNKLTYDNKGNLMAKDSWEKTLAEIKSEAVQALQSVKTPSEGIKHDGEKPDMSLLSSIALFEVAKVMTHGKSKYGANNWRGGLKFTRLLAASLRHTFSYLGGESKDPETGLSHAAHAICGLMMLLEFEKTRPELDDRYKENQ